MLTNNPPDGITAGPVKEDDLLNWEAVIQGPEGTPFEDGVFAAELKFPNDYPLSPPTMKFLGEMWHPNSRFPKFTNLAATMAKTANASANCQFTPAASSASPFFTPPATTLTTTSTPPSAGLLSNLSRRSSSPS